jgi:hypothetical protein
MTSWKPIQDAPKDGRSVLLWARLKISPAEKMLPVTQSLGVGTTGNGKLRQTF